MKKHSAIALFSGGLDSLLAVKWMQSRGYTIYPVFFRAPYLKANRAILSAQQNNIDLEVIDVSEEHLKLLEKPVYGFGKWLNPCIDCHGFMFRKAAELMEIRQASFLISGEVLGQRPMSQRRDALDSVAKLSGVRELLVRPLCQALLPDTKPILEGWVDKADMLSIHGRGRHEQMKLAKELGVNQFPPPAGGCLLTDRNYCLRLKDLIDRQELKVANLELLSYGRHYRISESTKLIVGRDEADNDALEAIFTNGYKLYAKDIMGPLGLVIGNNVSEHDMQIALSVYLYYNNKADSEAYVEVQEYRSGKPISSVSLVITSKASSETIKQYILSYS
jgi:tRNA U34 2-thiouridine synthase MnmA/TrmU